MSPNSEIFWLLFVRKKQIIWDMGLSILLSSVCGHFYVILYECGVKLTIMAEQVVEFPSGGYKIRKIFA